ncbi:high-affinity nickel-transport family protein [Candidatus Daviesbacteria bacterium]|nr:high-affinity nickel-transport family protein [Candidatus Daviesbacteria bacterium]
MYAQIISILSLSFLLGMRHATDPDHIVAITTIIAKQKKGILNTALIGALWGIGHSITVTLVAIPIIIFSFVVPSGLEQIMELVVGLMLIILGVLNLSGISSKIQDKLTPVTIHKHSHLDNQGHQHSHLHLHSVIASPKGVTISLNQDSYTRPLASLGMTTMKSIAGNFHHLGLFQTIRPLVIGLIHGLAGSTAIALLILSTIQNTVLSIIYLLVFHIGIITGMMILTLGIGASIILLKRESKIINHYLVTASGLLSIVFGLYLLFQAGISFLGMTLR